MFTIALIPTDKDALPLYDAVRKVMLGTTGGYSFVTAANAVEAVGLLKGVAPQLVVCSDKQIHVWAEHANLDQRKAAVLVMKGKADSEEPTLALEKTGISPIYFGDKATETNPTLLLLEVLGVAQKIQAMPDPKSIVYLPERPISAGEATPPALQPRG